MNITSIAEKLKERSKHENKFKQNYRHEKLSMWGASKQEGISGIYWWT